MPNNLATVTLQENKLFNLINGKRVLKASGGWNGVFDAVILGRHGIEVSASLPTPKVTNNHAFQDCERLETVEFEANSSLESIETKSDKV